MRNTNSYGGHSGYKTLETREKNLDYDSRFDQEGDQLYRSIELSDAERLGYSELEIPSLFLPEPGGEKRAEAKSAKKVNAERYILVTVHPDASEREVLVATVMKLLLLSRFEAETVIEREQMHWAKFYRHGHHTTGGAMEVHKVRLRQKWLERTVHEPYAPDQQPDAETMALYREFGEFVAEKEQMGTEANLGELFDAWAKEKGIFPELPEGFGSSAREAAGSYQQMEYANAIRRFESEKEKLTELLFFDRVRSQRALLARGIGEEMTSMIDNLRNRSDQLAVFLPPDKIREYASAAGNINLFDLWLRVRLGMFQVEDKLFSGTSGDVLPSGLGDAMYNLAYYLEDEARKRFGRSSGGEKQTAGEYPRERAQAVHDLLALGHRRTEEDNRLLLWEFYRLHFAVFEVAGRWMEYQNTPSIHKPRPLGDAAKIQAEGTLLKTESRRARKMIEFLRKHPAAQKVHAYYYPEAKTDKFRLKGDQAVEGGLDLHLYVWFDHDEGDWVLEDFTEAGEQERNHAAGEPGGVVPGQLFTRLAARLDLPKGVLFYRVPAEASYRILRVAPEMEWFDALRIGAMLALAAAMAIATAGASVAATAIIIGAGLANATAAVGELIYEEQNDSLSTKDILFGAADIVSSLAMAGSGALKLAITPATQLASGGMVKAGEHLALRIGLGVEVAGDTTMFLMFLGNSYEQLTSLAQENPGNLGGFARAMSMLLGLGLLQVVGIRGSVKEASGMGGAGLKRGVTEAEALEKLKRAERQGEELGKSRGRIDDLKAESRSLNDQIEELFKEQGVWGFIPDPASAIGILAVSRYIDDIFAGTAEHSYHFLMAFGPFMRGKITLQNYRRLFSLVKKMAVNTAEITYESVRLFLRTRGIHLNHSDEWDREIIEMVIKDVRRQDMSKEELEFLDSYYLNVDETVYTNYELREFHRNGYTINPKTGKINAPKDQPVEYEHSFLDETMRTEAIDFKKHVDLKNDSELMALVRRRQELRLEMAQKRDALKKRVEAGEAIPEKEMAAYRKEANKVGLYSEAIAEKSLKKYLDGEGFVQVYPEIGAASSKAGDFDRIYVKEENGRFLVFEVKGGGSPIQPRRITDVPWVAPGTLAEQGTRPYLLQILVEMGKKERTRSLARRLEKALDRGNLDYLYFRQDFGPDGSLKVPEIDQFDISKTEKQ